MKKFFQEFKVFITRGNVLDMAVGVIVGGAFTGIVNGLSNYILKPIINWLLSLVLGANGLSGAVTFLSKAEVLDTATNQMVVDLANSIYIDWGAFISAVINFFIIAFVLFSIVKTMNRIKEGNEKLKSDMKKLHLTKEEKTELKQAGVNIKDIKAVQAYYAQKEEQAKIEAEKVAKQAKIAEEEAKKNSTEGLLKQIKELLEQQLNKA